MPVVVGTEFGTDRLMINLEVVVVRVEVCQTVRKANVLMCGSGDNSRSMCVPKCQVGVYFSGSSPAGSVYATIEPHHGRLQPCQVPYIIIYRRYTVTSSSLQLSHSVC